MTQQQQAQCNKSWHVFDTRATLTMDSRCVCGETTMEAAPLPLRRALLHKPAEPTP